MSLLLRRRALLAQLPTIQKMISPIMAHSGTLSATTTIYVALGTNLNPAAQSIEGRTRSIMSEDGIFLNWGVRLGTAPGVDAAMTFTLMRNGLDTGVSVTITGTDTFGSADGVLLAYNDKDEFSVRCVPTNTPAATSAAWSIEHLGTGQPVLSGDSQNNTNATASVYYGFHNGSLVGTPSNIDPPFPTSGVIDHLRVNANSSPGAAPQGYQVTLVKNGVDTNLTCLLQNAQKAWDDTHSITVAPGDRLYYRCDPVGGVGTVVRMHISARFIPDILGESVQLFGTNANMTGTTQQASGGGIGAIAWSVSENSRHFWLATDFTIKKMYAEINGTAILAAQQYNNTFRSGQANTPLAVQLAGAVISSSDLVHTFDHDGPDWFGVLSVPSASPNAPPARTLRWGLVTYRAP